MSAVRILAPLCVTLMAFFGVVPSASSSYPIDIHDGTANRSRTFKAYTQDAGTLFEIFFRTTTLNEKRRVQAQLNIAMPWTASDELLVGTYTIYCAPAGSNSGGNKISGSQNVLRGRTMSLNPHYLFTATVPGDYHCWVRVVSGRPRPTDSRISSNVFFVSSGSHLQSTSVLHPRSSQGYTPREPSTVIKWGRSGDVAVADVTAPVFTNSLNVSGDLWLTTCSSRAGSKDPVTGKYLCDGLINRAGSIVVTKVVVAQGRVGGGYCKISYPSGSSGRRTFISKDVHHRLIFESGATAVSNEIGCTRKFRIKIHVKHVGGAAVAIHNQGTITTTIMPPGSSL